MGELRSQLLPDGGIVHFSKRSLLLLPSGQATMSRQPQQLDFVAAIFYLAQQLRCAGLGLARALASAQDLRPTRERKGNGAAALSPDTSSRLWKGRDLLSDSTGAVTAARFPGVA